MTRRVEVAAIAGAQFGVGVLLLARPAGVCRVIDGRVAAPRWVPRLLGARMVAQAIVELTRPTAGILLAGAGVDAVHAASMAAVAVGSARHRRIALASAGLAAIFAAALSVAFKDRP